MVNTGLQWVKKQKENRNLKLHKPSDLHKARRTIVQDKEIRLLLSTVPYLSVQA